MSSTMSDSRKPFPFKALIVPGVVMLAFVGLSLWGFLASGYVQPLIMFGYIGTALGIGLGLYGTLPKKQKPFDLSRKDLLRERLPAGG